MGQLVFELCNVVILANQVRRKRIEEVFGWDKTIGLLRKLRHRGRDRIDWIFTFTNAVYNLIRIRTLIRVGVCA